MGDPDDGAAFSAVSPCRQRFEAVLE